MYFQIKLNLLLNLQMWEKERTALLVYIWCDVDTRKREKQPKSHAHKEETLATKRRKAKAEE